MLTYPYIDPVAFEIGPVAVRWYGLMYLLGFLGGWWLGRVRARRPGSGWTTESVGDLLFYIVIGIVVGGRLGYMLFYAPFGAAGSDIHVWEVWKGGMSFHGGLLGVIVAMWLYGRFHAKRFFQVADFVAPLVPPGLAAGRIGNFINGELWGKASDVAWAMQLPCTRFPQYCEDPGTQIFSAPRHPSQLYEFLLEGVVLFAVLWLYSHKPRPTMAVSGMFLLCYGLLRFIVEFVRLPDAFLGYVAFGWVTMGQVLSVPMILAGGGMIAWAHRRRLQVASSK